MKYAVLVLLSAFAVAPKLPGGKVGLTEDESKIDVLETKKNLKKKLGKTFCEPGNIANNPVLAYVKDVIIPLNDGKGNWLVN